ncbi:MAG: Glycolate dehydrogenase, FAD-binding subunit GlcE [uncultured Solirubrobacteraceae bacterium]|uniref:Glycolate dehydrogenase, FAD-binding subunit GlcE n=1 Tax=uncultured Solirubrobacteraceae bacterium TaxID=1162706 RepID=A0A6J4S4C9_9ACTN|nr:MAG: Glycolate dehydrogenase, FAD-binding subunit GlcE [uncultured Solirubrobacteraceae bacterium]
MTAAVDSVEELQEAVRRGPRVLPVAGGTKPALSTPPSEDVLALDVSGLRGIVEYDPAELTLTARAGTPVAEVADALAEHGQYLPFDPPLARAGATLGGAVAAGASGPGAFRHGGVRDFVIGVRLVEGTGRLVAGGGRVVKNAAGFDLPKLMVGSMGRLGVLVQLSLKVFPRPRATATLVFDLGTTRAALAALAGLARGPLALDALDLHPPGRLLVRLGGAPEALEARAARLAEALPGTPVAERLDGEAEAALWRDAAELAWMGPGTRAVRVGLTARAVPELDELLADAGASARYSLGANVAWVAWPHDRALAGLDLALRALGLSGMALTGPPAPALLGARGGGPFAARIRSALDPHGRFGPEA